MRVAALLLLLAAGSAAAQAPERIVSTTVQVGGGWAPDDATLMSGSIEHARAWGVPTVAAGLTFSGELFGAREQTMGYVLAGATRRFGPLLVSALAGPSVGTGVAPVYRDGTSYPDGTVPRVRTGQRDGLTAGLRGTARATLVLAPEVGLTVAATGDATTLGPMGSVQVGFSFGTHRRGLAR